MASGFKKKTDFFAQAAEAAQERQDAIVESVTSGATEKRKPGRPKKIRVEGEEENVGVTFYITESQRKRLKLLAVQEDSNVSSLVRDMLDKYLDEVGA